MDNETRLFLSERNSERRRRTTTATTKLDDQREKRALISFELPSSEHDTGDKTEQKKKKPKTSRKKEAEKVTKDPRQMLNLHGSRHDIFSISRKRYNIQHTNYQSRELPCSRCSNTHLPACTSTRLSQGSAGSQENRGAFPPPPATLHSLLDSSPLELVDARTTCRHHHPVAAVKVVSKSQSSQLSEASSGEIRALDKNDRRELLAMRSCFSGAQLLASRSRRCVESKGETCSYACHGRF